MVIFLGCEDKKLTNEKEIFSDTAVVKTKTYIFGVHPLLSSKKLYEVYQPLVDKINENLKDGKIKLESSISYASFNEKMISGYFDFALPNPYQTITSLKYGYEVFGKMGDDESFRGIILLRKDSKIKNVIDNILMYNFLFLIIGVSIQLLYIKTMNHYKFQLFLL